jgi:hypothetical protein
MEYDGRKVILYMEKCLGHPKNQHPGKCISMLHSLDLGIIMLRARVGKYWFNKKTTAVLHLSKQHGVQSVPTFCKTIFVVTNFSKDMSIV